MGYVWLTFSCAACSNPAMANPLKVVSLLIEGQREPICRSCADKWNEIHRTSKGLPPVDYGDAYDMPADESDLD